MLASFTLENIYFYLKSEKKLKTRKKNCICLACVRKMSYMPLFNTLLIMLIFFFQYRLMLSHDGSGKGAALVAAVADRMLQEKKKVQSLENDMESLNVQSNS